VLRLQLESKELYRAAVAMHEMTRLAAPHIRPKGDSQNAIYLGYYFNLGFAVELYLKAYIRNATGEDVSVHGHKLDKLLKVAILNGFNFQKQAMTRIVEIIGSEHQTYKYRYAEGAEKFNYIEQIDLVEAALTSCESGMAHLSIQVST